MAIEFRPAAAQDVAQFIEWRYEPPYDVYSLDMKPAEAEQYFLDPSVNCHSILADGDLFGYCTFGEDARVPGGDYAPPALDIGAAMRPDATGQGRGRDFVAAIVDFATAAFSPDRLRVSIASYNERAIRVWTANGFEELGRFDAPSEILGSTRFVLMGRAAQEG